MRQPLKLFLVFHLAAQSLASALTSVAQQLLGHDDNDTPFHPSFDTFVERLMQDWHVPGLAIAVVHENKSWSKGFGYASLPDVPFTPHTLFQGASTTKSFTSSLAALLVGNTTDYGHIDWSSPLHELIGNDFVLKDSYTTTHVNLLDALSHRTGMPRHDVVWYDQDLDVGAQTRRLRHVSASAGFRATWQYCNLMYTAVSHSLQTVTGKSQADLLREWIFEPLGMNESYYSQEDAAACQQSNPDCRLADSYVWDNETSSYKKWPLDIKNPPNGAGGVISNVVDYARWIHTLMYETGPVSKEGHAMLKHPLSVEALEKAPYTGPLFYGLGLDGGVYRNERVFSHDGAISGYASTLKFMPDRKFGLVVFQNAQNPAQEAIGWRLIDEFLGVPKDEFADMNKTQFDRMAEMEEQLRTKPTKLYPDVPSIPVQPRLPLQNYTGTYSHAGYGNWSVSLNAPSGMLSKEADVGASGSAGLPLYATSGGQSVLVTLHHVSGEHWLVETRFILYDARVADDYSKAKFEVGADGIVQRLAVVFEAAVPGDEAWVWLDRVR